MLYTELAFITGGASLAMGAISLFIGIKNKNRANLLFGIMGICLTVFFLLPPSGFILEDVSPYPANIIIKRFFIFSYYGLIPWFIAMYTGYKNRFVPYFNTVATIITYGIMVATPDQPGKPLWSQVAVLAFGAIFVHGMKAGLWQFQHRDREKARWIILSMVIYGFLFLATTINQLADNFVGYQLGMKLFFPIHFHYILFVIVMGLEMVSDVLEKHKLELAIRGRDEHWTKFMQHVPTFVLEIDRSGSIVSINSFGVQLLGYQHSSELINKNWFDNFVHPDDAETLKNLFSKIIRERQIAPYLRNTITNQQGSNITIDWTSFLRFSDRGEVSSIVSIGRDLSTEEKAQVEIKKLKLELEKEIIASNPVVSSMPDGIIGESQALRYVIQKANQVAATQAPVLLEGETGVGKEVIADLIHKLSLRKDKPFVKVNCGALPKELIEDEFFGHEKGAFTSAIHSRQGRFELANGGTIFLDEIGELPIELQPKLLRVLQNGEFERVGGQKNIRVDVRIIAATNRNLQHDVAQGRFRGDLFYRLDVFPITIPALRQRKEDIPLLVRSFIQSSSLIYGKTLDQISKADLHRLTEYPWPGNIRELKNVMERAVITSEGSTTLRLDWFFSHNEKHDHLSDSSLDQIERDHILKVIMQCQWKINGEDGAAEKLRMHPNTLRSRMKKLGIQRPLKNIGQ